MEIRKGMKQRLAMCMLLVFMPMCIFSQKHMMFMGIPIDGDAASFYQKLINKGFIKEEANLPNAFCMMGKFYDEDANIQVDYDPRNRIVYSVTVYIVKNSFAAVYPIQRDILKAIEDKYRYEKKLIDQQLYKYDYYIYDGLDPVGLIQTFIVDSRTMPSTRSAMLSLSYVDIENYLNYENRKREDI